MTHTLTLRTTDAATKSVASDGSQYVLDAAAAQGVVLPAICKKGSCGTCVATVTAGDYTMDPYSPDALGSTAGEHDVLLCRTRAESDLTIELPYDNNRIATGAPPVRTGTVTGLDRVADGVLRLRVRLTPEGRFGSAAEFDAGQYMQIEHPDGSVKRAYTMANTANWDGDLEFFVHPVEGGRLTGWLDREAAVGDTVTLHGPQGAFGLRENGLRPRWFVGGGTGMSQLLSMLRRMAQWGDRQPARLFVGVTTAEELFATEAVAELERTMPDLDVHTAVWRPPGGELAAEIAAGGPGLGTVSVGTAAEILTRALERKTVIPDVYVCGPPALVDSVETTLAGHGVTDRHVLVERIVEN